MRRLISLTILLCVCAAAPAAGDVVHLRNGESVEGSVSREGDKVIVTRPDGSRLTLAEGEIDRIEETGTAAGPSPDSPGLEPAGDAADAELEQVLAKLRADSDRELNRAIAEFKAMGERAVPGLAAALKAGRPEERLRAARALAEIASSSANESLQSALADDDPRVRAEAARALGAISSCENQPALIAAMLDDKNDDVRVAAATSLCRINGAFSIPFLVSKLSEPVLRSTVEQGLLKADNPCTASFLVPPLNSADPDTRRSAAILLTASARPSHASMLMNLAKDKEQKRLAQSVLARLRSRKEYAVPLSITLLGDEETAKAAGLSLRRVAGKDLGEDPAQWRAWWNSTIPCRIHVVPFGLVSRELVRKVAAAIQGEFKVPVAIAKPELPIPAGCRFENGQHNADAFLDVLDEYSRRNPDAMRVIGVTEVNLGLPGSGYYFSPARPGGPVVVSSWRLRASESITTFQRTCIQAIHALAYSLHLPPCAVDECPYSDVFVAEDLDAKKPCGCKDCAGRIAWLIGVQRALAAWDPNAVDMFESTTVWSRGGPVLMQAAIVCEMWNEKDKAAGYWRRFVEGETDPLLAVLMKKRLELVGL
ncbi:MAG TPA: HEAT repeat domain-containing protein [Planctomycetota bacterium]|nr:HEAT repeat domain-containing protein [Planctomycetota bacterium]